eukprot:TRINITY_DN9260_c0_g1::TRINITY_DN9260_c0_g1_i1::g.13314::m.13314 TRINITY_DN9260_c0_g1::TRINITY_DN9260_c0_g1_i1::g.13314  ORF type:complete len:415 (+),score=59.80,sp/A6H6X4/KCTD4_BOVIN/43.96/1e-11,BTB_2/PF02214.17/8.2e+03,BTB_2/PF02214.17/2.4e-17,DUF87/PF01935.12/0.33,Fib_alpha/PF08702.5/0.57 TRINITY_DN9260_c0_g1_i1:41-1246(+)
MQTLLRRSSSSFRATAEKIEKAEVESPRLRTAPSSGSATPGGENLPIMSLVDPVKQFESLVAEMKRQRDEFEEEKRIFEDALERQRRELEQEKLKFAEDQLRMRHRLDTELMAKRREHDQELNVLRKTLEMGMKRLADQKAKIRSAEVDYSTKVKLNVGGRIFVTSPSTLGKYPGSMLVAFTNPKWKPCVDDGAYFIDRDPELFSLVLKFLRTGRMPRGEYDLEELKAEFEFYLLPAVEIVTNSDGWQILRLKEDSSLAAACDSFALSFPIDDDLLPSFSSSSSVPSVPASSAATHNHTQPNSTSEVDVHQTPQNVACTATPPSQTSNSSMSSLILPVGSAAQCVSSPLRGMRMMVASSSSPAHAGTDETTAAMTSNSNPATPITQHTPTTDRAEAFAYSS